MASSATNNVMRHVSITNVNVKLETVCQTAPSASMATFAPKIVAMVVMELAT